MKPGWTPRERIILTLAGILVLAYVFTEYVAEPLFREQKRQEQNIENKINFITKYHEILNQKSYYREKEKANRQLSIEIDKLFLSPMQPALAAAGLQKSLEDKARKAQVQLVQVKTEKTKYTENLLTVPVQITIKSSLEDLSRFIRSIESDEKFLVIEDLTIRRINKKDPERLESQLLVSGFIQQRKPEKTKRT
ncbi:MAG: type II secretion system protein GspM [Nitrospinota bacterium]|nr:type II secretion system protein GspM [Nitrospinota bacterium]